ncbi:MAG: 16S rRNA (uracil(1498)-N(3))-methyltransferase [Candidatus Accumulibacter sp.]|jgi:16S rRNA (uracil1498-N3)-methyltransferase|nr:16S rRNA (uracil(1498)-N(3))-methyltransferase [Accumulibacter sp.]
MRPPRFFSPSPLTVGARVHLSPGAARHAARALRLDAGDALTLFDGRGGEYACRIESRGREGNGDALAVEVLSWRGVECESPVDLTLVQALQAGEKMDLTVQKAVELGASRIAPVATRRSVVRLAGERAKKRVAHWRAVAASACEQCGRNRVPEVADLTDLPRWLEQPRSGARPLRLMLDPEASLALDALPRPEAATGVELLIGAEGGLAPEERELSLAAGFVAIRLGPRVLRTETAGLAALAAIQCLWGDFGNEGFRMFQSTPVTGRQHMEELTPLPCSVIPMKGEVSNRS